MGRPAPWWQPACCPRWRARAPARAKVFLSMSYVGNDWQAEASNMVKAMAAHPSLADKIDLQVQVAGPNAQKQIQQINAMVQAGAKAIVIFPISPTALNQVVRSACAKRVLVFAYDGEITEPCVHNVTIDQEEAGRVTAQWLADKLGGKGRVVMVTGVPGTSVDTQRTDAAKKVFAKYPDIKVVGEAVGMWSQAVARTELSAAGHAQLERYRRAVDAGGLLHRQRHAAGSGPQTRPVAALRGRGLQRRPRADAAGRHGGGRRDGQLRAHGRAAHSYASPPYSGALALKLAVQALEGKDVPKRVTLPLPLVTNDTIKLCQEGSWAEMKAGCNAFKPSVVQNPGWFASIFSADTPEVGLNAALSAQPEK